MKSFSLLSKKGFVKSKTKNFFSFSNSKSNSLFKWVNGLSFYTLTAGATTGVATPAPRKHGGLKDSDRIFTNLYRDGDPFVEGALKRVRTI